MRVAVVSGICVRNDAISTCVVDQLEALRNEPDIDDVALFTEAIDRQLDVPVHVVDDAWSLLVNPAFAAADLVIYHWGIAYDLFDSLIGAPGRGRRIAVHFHNATPTELLTGDDLAKGARSTAQADLLGCADVTGNDVEVWTYSEYNRRTLLDLGVEPQRLHHVPIAIDPPFGVEDRRSTDEVQLLVVGRLVPAKGVHVAVGAMGRLDDDVRGRVRLTIVGNVALSDSTYVAELRRSLRDGQLDDVVTIVDSPSRDELWHLYERAHVVVSPSFHEGLCVPIIEGYLAGCRAIGTDAGNVPFAVQPPDPIVPAGDEHALGDAISGVARTILGGHDVDRSAAVRYAEGFSGERARAALFERVRAGGRPSSTR